MFLAVDTHEIFVFRKRRRRKRASKTSRAIQCSASSNEGVVSPEGEGMWADEAKIDIDEERAR